MDIRATLRRHQKKLEKELRKLEAELSGVRAATAALGKSAGRQLRTVQKRSAKKVRKLSRAGRLAIAGAAKKRWAEWRKKAAA